MSSYKLRVDLKTLCVDTLLNLAKRYFERFCYVFEGMSGDNPHVHFYVYTSVLSATLRDNLRRLGLVGNGAYSLKLLDSDKPVEYIAYMMKEGNLVNCGVDQKLIDEAKVYDLRVKKELKSRKKQLDVIHEYVEQKLAEDKFNKISDKYGERIVSLPIIVEHVVGYHLDNGLLIRDFQIMSYARTLELRMNNRSAREKYVSNIVARLNDLGLHKSQ